MEQNTNVSWWLLFSNVSIIPSIVFTAKRIRHLWWEFMMCSFLLIVSPIYHYCFSYSKTNMIISYHDWWNLDHFLSVEMFLMISVYLSDIRPRFAKYIVHMVSLLVVYFYSVITHFNDVELFITCYCGIIIFHIVIKITASRYNDTIEQYYFSYNHIYLTIGSVIGGIGLLALIWQNVIELYVYTHTVWHVGTMLSCYFFLKAGYYEKSNEYDKVWITEPIDVGYIIQSGFST